jgi:hypothetical protein
MTQKPANPVAAKSKRLTYLEYALLGLCLCVIALRCTYTEGPPMQSTTAAANLGDNLYSLSLSAVLIFSFIVWIVVTFWTSRLSYCVTGIETGLGIFCLAAIIAGFGASDKRLAITDVAVFLAPVLMALLLVQILDSYQKIKLVLAVIVALGAVSAFQSIWQWQIDNAAMIEEYERNPQSLLEPLGIDPGTFQQFLFEHRLYSKGVRGFFTTRNSAGSFALMALFAGIVLFSEKFKKRKSDPGGSLYLFACGFIVVIVFFNLVLTRSKGAFIGLFLAAVVYGIIRAFGNRLKTHRKAMLVVFVLLCIAVACAIALYGVKHDRLPAGSSMLVRWQYWRASAQMYADNPLTGVGPGNFGHYYPRYKPPAALESVSDPHNFVLSILTQYGPLGLIGFLLMLVLPIWTMTSAGEKDISGKTADHQPSVQKLATVFAIVISAALLLIRPILMVTSQANAFAVIVYLVVTVYIAPVAVFFIAYIVITGPLSKEQQKGVETPNTNTSALLFCAVLAVVLHNLIDFAIFEPAVLTVFWAVFACLIAAHSHRKPLLRLSLKTAPSMRLSAAVGAVAMAVIYINYLLAPVAHSAIDIQRANQMVSYGRFQDAHQLLGKAAEADPLSASAPAFNGRLYLHRFGSRPGNDPDLLVRAAEWLKTAIGRNSAAFKNYERLTDTYMLLAEDSPGQERADWLDRALVAASEAVERYPGCGRLHFKLAQVAEKLGKTDMAIEHYDRATKIEDAYRDQFRRIYPERKEVVSRLGEERYSDAKQKVKLPGEGKVP